MPSTCGAVPAGRASSRDGWRRAKGRRQRMFCEGPTLLGKVCPKEGTRVRVLGVYHDTAWYGAVGHRGSRGRGSGVVIGERRSGVWQVVPEWVRGTGQAGRTAPAGWIRQGRSRGSIYVCCTTARLCEVASADSGMSARIVRLIFTCPRKTLRRPHEPAVPLRSPPTFGWFGGPTRPGHACASRP